jgi:hypothetical protein
MPQQFKTIDIPREPLPLDVTRPGQSDLMKSLPQSKWTRAKRIPGCFIVRQGEFTKLFAPGETWDTPKCSYQVQPDLSIRRLNPKCTSQKVVKRLLGNMNRRLNRIGRS